MNIVTNNRQKLQKKIKLRPVQQKCEECDEKMSDTEIHD